MTVVIGKLFFNCWNKMCTMFPFINGKTGMRESLSVCLSIYLLLCISKLNLGFEIYSHSAASSISSMRQSPGH